MLAIARAYMGITLFQTQQLTKGVSTIRYSLPAYRFKFRLSVLLAPKVFRVFFSLLFSPFDMMLQIPWLFK